jgi:hypothetical protein
MCAIGVPIGFRVASVGTLHLRRGARCHPAAAWRLHADDHRGEEQAEQPDAMSALQLAFLGG